MKTEETAPDEKFDHSPAHGDINLMSVGLPAVLKSYALATYTEVGPRSPNKKTFEETNCTTIDYALEPPPRLIDMVA